MTRNVFELAFFGHHYRPFHLFAKMLADPFGKLRYFDERAPDSPEVLIFEYRKVGFLTWEKGEEVPF